MHFVENFCVVILQDNGLVPIVEPEILLDGDHGIDNPLKWRRKCGLRSSSTLLRTMSCLKVSYSSPAW